MSKIDDDVIMKALVQEQAHRETMERVLHRIESLLVRIDERLQGFQDFVLEVTPDDARSAIAELEEELTE